MSPRKPTIDDIDDVDDEDGTTKDEGDYPADLSLGVRSAKEAGLGGVGEEDDALGADELDPDELDFDALDGGGLDGDEDDER